jgi:uncharacterized repeat protein (TIGR03803 family)
MKMFRPAVGLVLSTALITALDQPVTGSAVGGQVSNGVGDSAGFHLTVFHVFRGGADGATPAAALIQATDGNFYGTTTFGGTANAGTIFRITPAGVTTIMHTFTNAADGGSPFAAVLQASDGNLYGTTYSGGILGNGTVFKMTLAGLFTTIYNFAGGSDGANPHAALIQATDGNFYGTTLFGGPSNRGTLFGMTPGGAITVRYSFTGGFDGAYPYAPLIQATDGNLYGTTYAGDVATFGRVFRATLGGAMTVMHTFVNGADGASPLSALVEAADGNFYGTTHLGGASNVGTLFRMTPSGTLTVLKEFTGGADGASPDAALIQGADGNLYGTTKVGAAGYGTVFQSTLGGAYTVLHTFSGGGDGADSSAPLLRASDGGFYGTTNFGGGSSLGIVFRVSNAAPTPFTDDTLTAASSIIRAVHITELRTRIDAQRTKLGLAAYPYTDSTLTPGMTIVKAAHVIDLRTALNQAYDAQGLARPTYTDPNLDGFVIKVAHIAELRAAVIALE